MFVYMAFKTSLCETEFSTYFTVDVVILWIWCPYKLIVCKLHTEHGCFKMILCPHESICTTDFGRRLLSIRTTWLAQRRKPFATIDSMLGSPALSNTSVSGIWDYYLIQSIYHRHRWKKRSRVLSWCLYSVYVSLSRKRDVKTCFIDYDLCFEFNARRDLVVKTTSLSKRATKIYKRMHNV